MNIERYQHLRQLSRRLLAPVTKTIPREAYVEVGKALGILHNDTLVLDTLDVSSVIQDACVFDWIRDGRNLVETYFATHPFAYGTDEYLIAQACCRAKYRVLAPEAAGQGASTYWTDFFSRELIALMDIGLSQSVAQGYQGLLAARTIPIEDCWMTTGAGLPIGDRETGMRVYESLRRRNLFGDLSPAGEHKLAIAVVRACLDSGVAEHVRYLGADEGEEEEESSFGDRLLIEGRSPPATSIATIRAPAGVARGAGAVACTNNLRLPVRCEFWSQLLNSSTSRLVDFSTSRLLNSSPTPTLTHSPVGHRSGSKPAATPPADVARKSRTFYGRHRRHIGRRARRHGLLPARPAGRSSCYV